MCPGCIVDMMGISYFTMRYTAKTEAWKQLEIELDSKLWLDHNEKMQILKSAGDVMNYWLSYRNNKTVNDLKQNFGQIEIVTIND